MRHIKEPGLKLIKSFEGLRLKPYLCSANVPTIGYGSTYYQDKRKVDLLDKPITEEMAEILLQENLKEFESNVERMLKVEVNDNEFDALVSFAYNCGWQALEKSTLMRLLNSGADRKAVGDQFLRWNKAGGKELAGLTRRRQAERSLFLHPVQNNLLPEGPTKEDIEVKLQEIEDEVMKKP